MQKLSNHASATVRGKKVRGKKVRGKKVRGKKEKTAILRSRPEPVPLRNIERVRQSVSARHSSPTTSSPIRKRFGPAPSIHISKTKICSCPWELAPSVW